MYSEDDLIPLSSLQHYAFCRRQCALIHIEQVWQENVYTAEGRLLHEKVHSGRTEKRRVTRTSFGVAIRSLALGLSGKTDTVERGEDGTISIVEMKRGRPKSGGMDEVQLCAQALCLEEMLSASIPRAFLFYGKSRRRRSVELTPELRHRTEEMAHEVHRFLDAGRTPAAERDERCARCSLRPVCLPMSVRRRATASAYIEKSVASAREGSGE